MKTWTSADLAVDGPTLAAALVRAGLVDDLALFVAPVTLGGGPGFLPEGLRLELTLLDERRFASVPALRRRALSRRPEGASHNR
ncbi:MAG: dihydrofolate reductase family protein [Propionibacteriaceae bacterium]